MALLVGACSNTSTDSSNSTIVASSLTTTTIATTTTTFPPAPEFPTGQLSEEATAAIDAVWIGLREGVPAELVSALGKTGDPRISWILSDLMRFTGSEVNEAAEFAVAELTQTSFGANGGWQGVTDRLIAWDLPAFPGYVEYKRQLFTIIEPKWEPFFDETSAIDYRWLSWGGVLIDDRPLDDTARCARGCIPALDHPAVVPAIDGDWYPDDGIIFGLVINGEARAYPKNIMEVHEMSNDTLGGRNFALPYCTLCGSAQAFFTDEIDVASVEQPVLRTSGLLSRSNKVMYDLVTFSVIDTFRGIAVSGPLFDAGVVLPQATVVTTTWREWRDSHPDTTILAADGGIGGHYPLDPLGGRDDNGPIFPIGDTDPRLPVQEQVVGVILDDGTAVAFGAAAARRAIADGDSVELQGVRVVDDGGGLRAELFDGSDISSHQSFWFAWSQFHADTWLWIEP